MAEAYNPELTFKEIVHKTIGRQGITELMNWLNDSDFFKSPSSTRFHGAFEGGLVEHSLNVYRRLKELANFYQLGASEESIAIVALFHDLCKVNSYKVEYRNAKTERGTWEKVPYYTRKEDYPFGAHGGKSCYMVSYFMRLTPVEAAAIASHMGSWDSGNYNNAGEVFQQNHLAWLLHVADEAATYMDES